MKRNTLFASLATSLFVVATVAQANEGGSARTVLDAGDTIMEGVQPAASRLGVEQTSAIESPFPTQGPDDE
ncbi:MAG: hypothetical protein EHM59_18845 [Betaproteobacteria bacterium]|nr:MAG: hypothetical protein EHM59_18845 [Betaproteobacteria bacterium]